MWLVSCKKCSINSTAGSNDNDHIISFKLVVRVVTKAKVDNFSVLKPISMTYEPISSEPLRYVIQDTHSHVLSNSESLTQLTCFSSLTTYMIYLFLIFIFQKQNSLTSITGLGYWETSFQWVTHSYTTKQTSNNKSLYAKDPSICCSCCEISFLSTPLKSR